MTLSICKPWTEHSLWKSAEIFYINLIASLVNWVSVEKDWGSERVYNANIRNGLQLDSSLAITGFSRNDQKLNILCHIILEKQKLSTTENISNWILAKFLAFKLDKYRQHVNKDMQFLGESLPSLGLFIYLISAFTWDRNCRGETYKLWISWENNWKFVLFTRSHNFVCIFSPDRMLEWWFSQDSNLVILSRMTGAAQPALENRSTGREGTGGWW